ncbi:uroporphyrinogen decarboxylase [Helicobacter sp. 16-1353]|uniref:uroporphyrinogen decarboxylase n=1 Tax=Helicobacter sp. 16-1353 TaxID=2004996 RepID=UPI000DCBF90C|nr:uroporphyrinogen decarboxylase [Helicobacter sp. 16-1353]RAX54253.1 uroporphyrinogen decarboxylase [Helicobacter sp. 16-1353]
MIFIDACKRKDTPYTPIWLMRQAGRYLSEYREVRAKAGNFLDLCKNPALSCEVTLQPIDILDCDAAILFSDILVIPLEMGLGLNFLKNEGPKFETCIRNNNDLGILQTNAYKKLDYVYDTISLTRAKLSKDKALIGFCGAPWTLATYMIEGQGSKTYTHSKKMLYTNPNLLRNILEKLTNELKLYLESQIKAGVDAIMIFDSWAGALEEKAYIEFGFNYINEIADYIKKTYSNIPIIVFPKGVGGFLDRFANLNSNFDVFGIDWGTSMKNAKHILGDKFVLQGNLEPCRIYDMEAMESGIDDIINIMGNTSGHIFNLGHGMLPDLPVSNAIRLVQLVREKTKR